MNIPNTITQALKKPTTNNNYFYMHKKMRVSLDAVAEGKDIYASYHFSMLINDLELCLKGFLFSKQESGEWKEPHAHYLTEDHKLYKLIAQVQKFIPLFNYTEPKDWEALKVFCANLGRQYTTARYSADVPFEDFVQLNRDFVLPQIEKLYEGLKEKKEPEFDFTPGL